MWSVLAFAKLGDGAAAADLFSLLNPVNHALTPSAVERYKVEPYVVAADIYSVAPHVGRGGWTWYTGAAGWMYQAGVEGILGIHREGASLVIAPCLPPHWPGYEATVQVDGTCCDIRVVGCSRRGDGDRRASLDGAVLRLDDRGARVPLDGGRHVLQLDL
jgi:cyclic beta-1,2-glucan synthetase